MRVVLLSWAKIWDGAALGGGSNGYLSALGLALAERGHDVVSLCGGTTYDDEDAPPRVVRHADWRGIRVFEVVNSPILAPSLAQFRDPLGEVSAPALERLVGRLAEELRPDVLHVHNLEGFSAGCLDAVRAASSRPRVVFSLHTYHPVCPQVFLVQGNRTPCLSYDNGHACDGCVPAYEPAAARRLRVAEGRRQPVVEVGAPGAATAPLPPYDPDARGGTPDRDPRRHYPPDSGARVWVPLDNVALPEPPSDRPPNAYAARRAAMVDMLGRCDAVLAVSRFVRDKYAALGVRDDVLSTLYIGSAMPDLAALVAPAAPPPSPPVRLAFLGFNMWHKGLPLLADALGRLDAESLARLHLSVFAGGGYGLREMFAPVEPRLAGLTVQNGYDYTEIPLLLAGVHLGLVTSVWWDNAPQTVMEMLACGVPVLGARLGGIPDFVTDGRNGLLFRGNDPADLARRLTEVARDPALVDRLRAGVVRPKTMREHVGEIERVYAGERFDQRSPFPEPAVAWR